MLSIRNKLYNETLIVTDLKIQDNTRPAFYLTIDSDSDGSVYTSDRTLTIDTVNTSPTLEIGANLTIEATSLINQDLTTDAAATFNTLNLAATSSQIVLQSGGVTGTITATPTSGNKVWTLQDVTGTIYQTGGTDVAVADGGTGVGSSTGTVAVVLSNTPTLVSPVLGAATGTSLAVTAGMTVNSGGASGEVGINFTSINSTFSTIAQSDAEGIGTSSDLRIGLDPTTYNLIIAPRALIGNDFGLTAASDPTLRIYDSAGSNYVALEADTLSLGSGSAYFSYSAGMFTLGSWGKGITFHQREDLVEGNLYTFESAANIELTDDDGQQAWMYLDAKILQTNTAAVDVLHVNIDTANLTYGDGTSGDGNNLFRLAVGGTTKFKVGVSGNTAITSAAVGDDGRGLSSICHLAANGKSDGIAAYFEGHIDNGVTTDGVTYGMGAWLNVDSGATTGADIRALDIGIYEAGANCTGGNAYGLAIHMDFDDTNPPAAIYPFRINCNSTGGHATPDALIFAPNAEAIALTTGDPGTADDAYLKIHMQNGDVYRIPLVKE